VEAVRDRVHVLDMFSAFSEKVMTLSKELRHICHFEPDSMILQARWKVASAFVKPNGIDHHWYIPQ